MAVANNWTRWGVALLGKISVTFCAGLVSVQFARSSIPKPPDNPELADICTWIISGSDPLSLIAALGAGLGVAASVLQLFGPKPYSEAQGKADRAHQNESFRALDDRTQQRFDEIDQQLKKITAQFASDKGVSNSSARSFVETVEQLAASQDEADILIAEQAVGGDPVAAAEALLAKVNEDNKRNARRARQAASIFAPYAPSRAIEAYQTAVDLDPSDVWSWIELGRLRLQFGSLAGARVCFSSAVLHISDDRDRAILHSQFADILVVEGALSDAKTEYEAAYRIIDGLYQQDPKGLIRRSDLAISLERLGDIEVKFRNFESAQRLYESSLNIRQDICSDYPEDMGYKSAISVAYTKIGNIEFEYDKFDAAKHFYEEAIKIVEKLLDLDCENISRQDEYITLSYKIGDVERRMGNALAARIRYFNALQISEDVVEREPRSGRLLGQFAVCSGRAASSEIEVGNYNSARQLLERGLDIRQRLAAEEPTDLVRQRDLVASHHMLGELAQAEGDAQQALVCYRAAEAILVAIVDGTPDHPGFRHDLAQMRRSIAKLQSTAMT